MLLNDFYTLENQVSEGNQVKALIAFNKSHRIFEGHFPGKPVVPGVCMMQILREVMEVELSQSLKISTGENLKFLSIINPEETPQVEVTIQYTQRENDYVIQASLQAGTVTFFRFKGTFEAKA